MKPLMQWVCDKCGGLIVKPSDGWLEWLSGHNEDGTDAPSHGFKVVHHSEASPLGDEGCYHYELEYDRSDTHLDEMIGPNGLAKFLAMLSPGPVFDEPTAPRRPVDESEYAECLRRLMIPHYEEARLYFDEARSDGLFDEANEIWGCMQDNLQAIIERYRRSE